MRFTVPSITSLSYYRYNAALYKVDHDPRGEKIRIGSDLNTIFKAFFYYSQRHIRFFELSTGVYESRNFFYFRLCYAGEGPTLCLPV